MTARGVGPTVVVCPLPFVSAGNTMDLEQLKQWDHVRIAGLLDTCTGDTWLRIARIIRDSEVHGRDLVAHVVPDDPTVLMNFFKDELGETITKFVAKQFMTKLAEASQVANGGGRKDATKSNSNMPAAPAEPPCVLHVQFSAHAVSDCLVPSRRLMVAVPPHASVALVRRRLLDALRLPLFSTLAIVNCGVELQDSAPRQGEDGAGPNGAGLAAEAPNDWRSFSSVHAILKPSNCTLTPDNMATHACVAERVTQGGKAAEVNPGARANTGLLLDIDPQRRLGNGAAGVTFLGKVTDLADPSAPAVVVAVKRFFMLETPDFYGLTTADEVSTWADRELFGEINTLLSLSHPNLVRLRCAGLMPVHGRPFPAYIALDYANDGTLENWIRQRRVTELELLPFLRNMVDAMTYLHVRMKIVHRDIKPDNVFLHRESPGGRPTLVVGDVRSLFVDMQPGSQAGSQGQERFRMGDTSRLLGLLHSWVCKVHRAFGVNVLTCVCSRFSSPPTCVATHPRACCD